MTSSPLISVVVPVFNVEGYIERCAVSLLEQTHENIEYIFVNDASVDHSVEILLKVIQRYPQKTDRIKIIHHEINKGNASARNSGLQISSGAYIIQIDSDDWIEPDMIEKMVAATEKNPDIICCGYIEEYGHKSKTFNFFDTLTKQEFIEKTPANLLLSSLWNKLIKRDLYFENNIKCYEGSNNWVDIGLIMRLALLAKKIEIVKAPLYHYNRGNQASVSVVLNEKRIDDMIATAGFISDFYKEQGDESYSLTLNYIKFLSKDRLLYDKRVRDRRRWKKTFPEANSDIWNYPQLTSFKKICFYMASKGFTSLACVLFDFRATMKRLIHI